MKRIDCNSRRILPSACVALLLIVATALPCKAQAIEGRSTGTAVLARPATQSPLPAPTGPYQVGRTEFDWVDPSRPDPESPSGHREIVVCLWYPASPKKGGRSGRMDAGKMG
jgi:predicted dienelactone hydrolase